MWSLDDRGRQSYTSAYPYPLLHLDGELLAAHALVHKFQDWPGAWPSFIASWSSVRISRIYSAAREVRLYYLLASSPDRGSHVGKFGLMSFQSVSQQLMHRSLVDALK